MSDAPKTFGPNAWLVDEMYRRYREDPASVDEAWAEFFEGYRPRGAAPPEPQPAPTRTQAPTAPAPAPPRQRWPNRPGG